MKTISLFSNRARRTGAALLLLAITGVLGTAQLAAAASPRGGKEQRGILVRPPPGAQLFDHSRGDGDVALLAAFAVAHQQAGWLLTPQNVFDPDADGFPHAQTAVGKGSERGRS